MTTDLEDRLRDMYAAVAAQTVVDDPVAPLATDEPGALEPASRRPRLLALAVVAAVVIGAVAFIAVRSRLSEPAVKPRPVVATGERVFALSGLSTPDGFGLDGMRIAPLGDIVDLGWVSGFPGVASMSPTDEIGAAHWTGPGGAAVTLVSAAAPGLQPADGTTTLDLPNGAVAQVTVAPAGGVTFAWREPLGPLVSLQATSGSLDDDTLRFMVGNVWLVDRTLWGAAATHAGYLSSTTGTETDGFDQWRPPGPDLGVTIRVQGSAQTSFSVSTGLTGLMRMGDSQQCEARPVDGADGRRLLLISNQPIELFGVKPRDGEAFTVPAGTYPGSTRWRFATVVLDGASNATVTCSEATS